MSNRVLPAGARVYLAGPMSGKPSYNAFAFTEARTHLRNDGWSVYCPSEADRRFGGNDEELPLAEYMARDLPHVVYEWPGLERV